MDQCVVQQTITCNGQAIELVNVAELLQAVLESFWIC